MGWLNIIAVFMVVVLCLGLVPEVAGLCLMAAAF